MTIIDDYIKSLKDELLPRTKKAYEYDIKHFLDYIQLRKIQIENVTIKDIKNYIANSGGGTRIASRRLSSISSFFQFLIDSEKISFNPVSGIKRKRIKKKLPTFLKSYEFDNIFSKCENILSKTILITFYCTGIRLSELVECTLNSFDIEKRELKVIGKGNKIRYVPVSDQLLPYLLDYLSERKNILERNKKESIYLFISNEGERLEINWIEYHIFMKLTKTTGIRITPHKLRHSFATNCIENGMSRECLQLLLGHEQLSTTDWYVHIKPMVREEFNKVINKRIEN